MKTLAEYIQDAEEKKVAIGHFNISNLEAFWAIFNAAKKLGVPVIIGVPERNLEAWRDFAGGFAVELRADFLEAVRWLGNVRTEAVAESSSDAE